MKTTIVILLCSCLVGVDFVTAANNPITNEEIHGAVMSLVYSYHLLENKLERHEHRERALGELVKKALQNLQKGQKAYEPMKGVFERLDERVNQIETMLISHEEKYNSQSEKLGDALEAIFKWITANAVCECKEPEPVKLLDTSKMETQIDKLTKNIENLERTTKTLMEQAGELIKSKLESTDEVILKLDDKITHYYVTTPAVTPPPPTPQPVIIKNSEFENKVSSYLAQIVTNVNALKQSTKALEGLSRSDKNFLQELNNETLNAIQNMKSGVLAASDKTITKTALRIKEGTDRLDGTLKEVLQNLGESRDLTEKFFVDVNTSNFNLHQDLDVFKKFDKILVATSDYVLDTQRKVEYGVHQILVKVGDLVKLQTGDLNATLQKRFDELQGSIIASHLETLQNLSTTIESEISHVWRQIEIMHNEVTFSKEALNRLQGQTEQYVNGTFTTMDSMEAKVSQITERMAEVDSNLNYLLGRLSLVTQEFNRIKIGLGNALDQIRSSFKVVEEKVKTVGPGPHDIPRNDYEDPEENVA